MHRASFKLLKGFKFCKPPPVRGIELRVLQPADSDPVYSGHTGGLCRVDTNSRSSVSSGTPVVALKSGAVSEIAGDAALLVEDEQPDDYAQALLTVISDTRLSKDLSDRGLLRAPQFVWAETARRTLEVYRSVLAES